MECSSIGPSIMPALVFSFGLVVFALVIEAQSDGQRSSPPLLPPPPPSSEDSRPSPISPPPDSPPPPFSDSPPPPFVPPPPFAPPPPSPPLVPPPPPPPPSPSPPPPPPHQPPPPPRRMRRRPRVKGYAGGQSHHSNTRGHKKRKNLALGKKLGIVFAAIVAILQIGVVGFLVFKRKQLLKVRD